LTSLINTVHEKLTISHKENKEDKNHLSSQKNNLESYLISTINKEKDIWHIL